MCPSTPQREEGNKSHNDNSGGKEDRVIDLGRRLVNRRDFPGEAICRSSLNFDLTRPHSRRRFCKMPVNVLHHDHGRIDDQAEIYGANRKQICGFAS